MIRQSFIVEEDDSIDEWLLNADELNYEIGQEVVNEIAPQFLADIRQPAPPVQYPIQWASERQRRAFFATNGFGKGIPTKRTGALEDAWIFEIRQNGDGSFSVVVENSKPYSKFTGGSLAQNVSQALRFQQPFHKNTGHRPYTIIVGEWMEITHNLYIQKHDERFGELNRPKTRKRAFTT